MNRTKLVKEAKRLIGRADTSGREKAEEYLIQALSLSASVSEALSVYELTTRVKLKRDAFRKAVKLLGVTKDSLWDLALISGHLHDRDLFSNYIIIKDDGDYYYKQDIILNKITTKWLVTRKRKAPWLFEDMIIEILSQDLTKYFEPYQTNEESQHQ